MNIPDKIRINGTDYKIKEDANLEFDGCIAYGIIDYEDCTISLNSSRNRCHDKKCLTLIHEMLHGIIQNSNIKVKKEEKVIEAITKGLYQVIQDNPEMFIVKTAETADKIISSLADEITSLNNDPLEKAMEMVINDQLNVKK